MLITGAELSTELRYRSNLPVGIVQNPDSESGFSLNGDSIELLHYYRLMLSEESESINLSSDDFFLSLEIRKI